MKYVDKVRKKSKRMEIFTEKISRKKENEWINRGGEGKRGKNEKS